MRKIYFILILLLLLAIFLGKDFFAKIGLSLLSMLEVSVKEKTDGKLLLAYEPSIEIGNQQKMYAEFINTGTKQITTKIELRVYGYLNNTLKPLAYYYDISVPLEAGMRKGFSSVFVPPDVGLYYIQSKAHYDTKVIETWGAFYVHLPPSGVIPIYVPSYPPTPPPTPPPGVPKLELEYPPSVKLYIGEKKLISVTVKNLGNAPAHNLKLYTSVSSLLNVSVSPKQVSILNPNQSVVFVISIEIPSTTEEGVYPIEFETMNDEGVKKRGEISIQVFSIPPSEEEEIYEKILNYEFLISEIQKEINYAFFEGYDVKVANESLKIARVSLENAKKYFRLGKIEDTKMELKKSEMFIEDAAFQLASLTLLVYRPPAVLWWQILFAILLMVLIVLILLYLRRIKGKRPKLLKGREEIE
ncbi:MAG: NEW3 domain-containing protein [Candidatus Aenigmatarchaeota archaeon]